eukprot:6463587-Amphidinium_carterae.1
MYEVQVPRSCSAIQLECDSTKNDIPKNEQTHLWPTYKALEIKVVCIDSVSSSESTPPPTQRALACTTEMYRLTGMWLEQNPQESIQFAVEFPFLWSCRCISALPVTAP